MEGGTESVQFKQMYKEGVVFFFAQSFCGDLRLCSLCRGKIYAFPVNEVWGSSNQTNKTTSPLDFSKMLRAGRVLLVKSHQLKKAQHPDAGTRFGRHYNRSMVRYGFSGFGISTYSTRKNRSFVVRPTSKGQFSTMTTRDPATGALGTVRSSVISRDHLSNTTKSMSPHWRSFALADGGVLFVHPAHKQIMTWNQDTLRREAEATGLTSMDQWVHSRMQALIADNTLGNVSLSHWRKRHMWALIKKEGKLFSSKSGPMHSIEKGARSTMEGNSNVA